MKKKLIVNAIPLTYVQTGIARYLRSLYLELEKLGSDTLDIWYFNGKKLSKNMPQGPGNFSRWSNLVNYFWKLPTCASFLIRLSLHIKTERRFHTLAQVFDLYHEAGFFPFKTPPKTRIIYTVHDLSLFRFPEHHPKERVLFAKLYWKSRCRQVDHYLSVSSFTKSELQGQIGSKSEDITVTPLACDPKVFYPRPSNLVESFWEQQGLPKQYFLFVGSGDPRKNMQIINLALQKANLPIPLVVTGWSGWSRNQFSSNVIPLGYVTDQELALLYCGALALVFPSTYEGFGLPVLEAMACGCPVVTTRKASLPEVADQAAVYIYDPYDPHELGKLLQELATSPERRKVLREKGLTRAEKFSWKQTASLTYKAFLQVLDQG